MILIDSLTTNKSVKPPEGNRSSFYSTRNSKSNTALLLTLQIKAPPSETGQLYKASALYTVTSTRPSFPGGPPVPEAKVGSR